MRTENGVGTLYGVSNWKGRAERACSFFPFTPGESAWKCVWHTISFAIRDDSVTPSKNISSIRKWDVLSGKPTERLESSISNSAFVAGTDETLK